MSWLLTLLVKLVVHVLRQETELQSVRDALTWTCAWATGISPAEVRQYRKNSAWGSYPPSPQAVSSYSLDSSAKSHPLGTDTILCPYQYYAVLLIQPGNNIWCSLTIVCKCPPPANQHCIIINVATFQTTYADLKFSRRTRSYHRHTYIQAVF